MKRLELTFLFSLVGILLFAKQNYTLTFQKSDYRINLKDSIISVTPVNKDVCYTEDSNAPALPYVVYRVLRPQGAIDEKPIVSFDEELLYNNVYIAANPQTSNKGNNKPVDNERIAKSSLMSPVLYSATQSMYGYTYIMLKITPFIYDIETKRLCFVSKINIKFDDVTITDSEVEYDRKKVESIKSFIINPDEIYTYYPQQKDSKKSSPSKAVSYNHTIDNGKVDYAIITSEALKPAFQDLIEWKIQKGLRAKIYTLTEIYESIVASQFQTNPQKIRRWIDYMYNYYDLKYVLIGGDASVVPVQYCRGKYIKNGAVQNEDVPSDLFYSTYSNVSPIWHNNVNGFVGEGLIVMTPNVYLTRVPVNTVQDVQHFVQKLLLYEKANGLFDTYYMNKMLFAGTHLTENNILNNSAYTSDNQMYSAYIQPYWGGNRDYLYKVDGTTYTNLSEFNTLTEQNLRQLINLHYHLLFVNCHGTEYSWDLAPGYFGTYSATHCENTSPSIIVTDACETNAFDALDGSLSMAFMNSEKGAVAYYGNSRQAFFYAQNSGIPPIGPSLLFSAYFFKYLFTGFPTDAPYRYGAVAAHSKMKWVDNANSSETDGWRYLQFSINPLGDPEMPIYTATPQNFSNVQISVGSNGNVTVSTGGVDSCTIALTSLDNGQSYFDVAENVSSYTFPDVYARCYVTITKHNYCPYQHTVSYPGISGPEYFYDSAGYSIDIPDNCTVSWSFANPNSINNDLLMTPSSLNNSCLINNLFEHRYINETLVATIKRYNTVVATRTKIISTGGDFSALVHQQGQTINGTTYPTLNNPIQDGGHTGVFELNPITITSSDFADAQFTIDGYQPTTWSKNSNVVTAVFPQISGTTAQIATITGINSVTRKIFQFTLHIQPSGVLNQILNILSNGDGYSISMTYGDDTELTDNWNLTIYNAQTGQVVYTQSAVEGETSVKTSGWKPGVYVVQGQANGEIIKEKILVK